MSRLIVVSNRVASIKEGEQPAGGLAVGVYEALKESGGLWFGWNGDVAHSPPTEFCLRRHGKVTFATLPLVQMDYDQYYRGFANATLWPTFHYRADISRYDREEYEGYRRVNTWLARHLAKLVKPEDTIWVHDYHLIPFAHACRDAGLRNRIGFFLHIPFPTEQVLATIPCYRELMDDLFFYDLIGFQTSEDQMAFADCAVRRRYARLDGEKLQHPNGRVAKVGTYPIGISPDELAEQAAALRDAEPVVKLRQAVRDRKLVLSVDRLDYSKGLVQRFQAFERLLQAAPEHRNHVSFVQISAPSREDVAAYQQIREQLESLAGAINGHWSDLDWTPIRYLNQNFAREEVLGLMRLSQVGYITPLRDGMNLVAKEYVAAQSPDDPGVLVLSRFAGAAHELAEGALLVNPYDLEGMAEALDQALKMPLRERRRRHAMMMERLRRNDIVRWRERFLEDLKPGLQEADARRGSKALH
ncbi:alpha,alpha-trehalose-phosphate synthase (UDP-forming) [Orrella sp. JC864]|uniref:alpha,alpha-trehalose-phosphate synthase (UDP-forming) n=1 Tax=Orrella sp. JC864 TaxID=3120298 RepID=UPI0030099E5E